MSSEQHFGGDWTKEKLDMFSGYLDAYLMALQKMNFKKIYIDAFAGTGTITLKGGQLEIAGSTKIALMAKRQFDSYYFIENDADKALVLSEMIEREFPNLKNCVTVCRGDANNVLMQLCKAIDWRYSRALLFVDPFATEFAWSTLEMIGQTKAFDVWYLFPLVALQRMLPRKGVIEPTWRTCINRLLGDDKWEDAFYKEDPQIDLFGTTSVYKDVNTDSLKAYIVARLKTVFPAVADNPKTFLNKKNSPLFLFCFAVASDNPRAQALALRIAQHILNAKG